MLASAFDQAGYKTVANYVPVWQYFGSKYKTWSRSKLGAGADIFPLIFFQLYIMYIQAKFLFASNIVT
jgi:hypothetical protein